MKINRIEIVEVEYIAYELAKKFMQWDEPIPEFGTRFPGRLESCLATPFQTFSKRILYPGLIGKAAMMFYLMVKNHPFENGNKRIAITTLLHFLRTNGKWLLATNEELYEFAKSVAASEAAERESVITSVEKFINEKIIQIPTN